MAYSAKILLDSISENGNRITTFEITYPRFVHAEFMTHRVFSRNAASSRAIPVQKIMERVMNDPAMPVYWGKNQKGMQAEVELTPEEIEQAKKAWLLGRFDAIKKAEELLNIGIHKQIANRVMEPWMFITVICTGTDFGNFFNLRCHKDAQPELQKIAYMMEELYYKNEPRKLKNGEWHIPLIFSEDEDLDIETKKKVSTGRCARVSYLTHDGRRDINEDIKLYNQLQESKHMSPFEHIACAMDSNEYSGNFKGWKQYRKFIQDENRLHYEHKNTL